jgi:hypothetical protein
VQAVPIPLTPGYVSLSLSDLSLDTSSLGTSFFLSFTSFDPVVWYSANSGAAPDFAPTAGRAFVYKQFSAFRSAGPWLPRVPYGGARLRAIKLSCALTPTQSQTITPITKTSTSSQSQTQTATQSQTLTPTQTGFPLQSVFDNTLDRTDVIQAASPQLMSNLRRYTVSFFMPEENTVCGPGSYQLVSITLPLSIDAGPASATILLQLWA